MIPASIPIQRDAGYHTDKIGSYGDGLQYMGFTFFVEANQRRPVSVLHRFDRDGQHIGSQIWESEHVRDVELKLDEALSKLVESQPGDIVIQPFNVELNGVLFGLIPWNEGECLEYLPYGLAFFPPWDGTYDT